MRPHGKVSRPSTSSRHLAVGPRASYRDGLTHVVRRTIEFDAMTAREVRQVAAHHRAFAKLYASSAEPDADIEGRVADALARTTTDDDTHPAPIDRFRLVHGINAAQAAAGSGLIWDLFADPPALAAEMTVLLASRAREVASALV